MPHPVLIKKIHCIFFRHDRNYCIFSVHNSADTYVYFSHLSQPLRSLFFGKDFLEKIPELLENRDLCIECGLGLSVAGGVALDGGDCVAWHCSIAEANRVLLKLKDVLGEQGRWIELF
jgi:hypothetical protein